MSVYSIMCYLICTPFYGDNTCLIVMYIYVITTGMSIEELAKLRPGSPRRGRHDDTTAVVMYL